MFRSNLYIACVPEIVSGFTGAEIFNERAEPAMEAADGSLGEFAQISLKLAEGHLDGIQVW